MRYGLDCIIEEDLECLDFVFVVSLPLLLQHVLRAIYFTHVEGEGEGGMNYSV